jgi:hypothetical protein
MLDAYHRDSLHVVALRISEVLVERFPDSTISLRNHARALSEVGQDDLAMEVYWKAMAAPDVDDTTATWLGNEYSTQGREELACVPYLIACELDPDDSENFVRIAGEVNDVVRARQTTVKPKSGDISTTVFSQSTVMRLLACAFSCKIVSAETFDRAQRILEKSDVDDDFMSGLIAIRKGESNQEIGIAPISRHDRIEYVKSLRVELESPQDEDQTDSK